MNPVNKSLAWGLALSLMLSACAMNVSVDKDRMYILSSQLTKLSAAVESTVRYKNPPASLDEQGLLKLATQHDPGLLEAFSQFQVHARSSQRHSVVLICTEDGLHALLEDAACTPALDRQHWRDAPGQRCEFTIETVTVCERPQ